MRGKVGASVAFGYRSAPKGLGHRRISRPIGPHTTVHALITSTSLLTSMSIPGCCFTITYPPLIRGLCRCHSKQFQIFVSLICSQTCAFIGLISNRRHLPIHILNNDVLLNIFDLYRLGELDQYEENYGENILGDKCCHQYHQRWWYKLVHVCRQWRNIILESPSRLELHLFCTLGVPVASMLAHSPPLPLTIDYDTMGRPGEITAEDESGILLALSHRDRVRHISLWMLPNMEKFVRVMDVQFPILECMHIHSLTEVILPETFQAPNLRNLVLLTASLSIGSPLLTTTAVGLVTLTLLSIPASAYFLPSYILTRLSLMPQLETLSISFHSSTPNRDVEEQSSQTPDMTTLPNLRQFLFRGTGTYLEGLVACIRAPSLSTFRVNLLYQFPFAIPRLCQFIQSSENLTFRVVQVTFGAFAVSLHAVPWKWDTPLTLQIVRGQLDRQVASAVQLFGTLSPVLSVVEQVAFYDTPYSQSARQNNVDRSQWRELLRPFTNTKTIHVNDGLISRIFRSLPSDDGESPLELLPNLEEIGYSGGSDARDAFTRFLNERQVSGHPVSLRLVDLSMFDVPPNTYP
jgi:hypothetical protein